MNAMKGLRALGGACLAAFFGVGGCGSSGNSGGADPDASATGNNEDGGGTTLGGSVHVGQRLRS